MTQQHIMALPIEGTNYDQICLNPTLNSATYTITLLWLLSDCFTDWLRAIV